MHRLFISLAQGEKCTRANTYAHLVVVYSVSALAYYSSVTTPRQISPCASSHVPVYHLLTQLVNHIHVEMSFIKILSGHVKKRRPKQVLQ